MLDFERLSAALEGVCETLRDFNARQQAWLEEQRKPKPPQQVDRRRVNLMADLLSMRAWSSPRRGRAGIIDTELAALGKKARRIRSADAYAAFGKQVDALLDESAALRRRAHR
jgi:hypothetical protein